MLGFIRHAPAAIAFKGLDGRFLHVNPGMEALLGLPAGAVLGRGNPELLRPEPCARAQARDERALRLLQGDFDEESVPHRDGSVHDYLVHTFPVLDPAGACSGLGVIATDITGQKQADR
ncbi:MAG: PAS domain-containing protein, partial [Verrucomicrobiota bacterium]